VIRSDSRTLFRILNAQLCGLTYFLFRITCLHLRVWTLWCCWEHGMSRVTISVWRPHNYRLCL